MPRILSYKGKHYLTAGRMTYVDGPKRFLTNARGTREVEVDLGLLGAMLTVAVGAAIPLVTKWLTTKADKLGTTAGNYVKEVFGDGPTPNVTNPGKKAGRYYSTLTSAQKSSIANELDGYRRLMIEAQSDGETIVAGVMGQKMVTLIDSLSAGAQRGFIKPIRWLDPALKAINRANVESGKIQAFDITPDEAEALANSSELTVSSSIDASSSEVLGMAALAAGLLYMMTKGK